MIRGLYTTSEFAKLCGVNKHTLYHYDDIGLLCPTEKEANGYRYYSVAQFQKFHIISILKETGTPLKEIKEYLDYYSKDLLVHQLKKNLEKLAAEQKKINRMHYLLSSTVEAAEHLLDVETNVIQIAECEEEYLIATEAQVIQNPCENVMLSSLSNHLQYCTQNNLHTGTHFGEIVLKEDIDRDVYLESYYYSRLEEKINDKRLFIKPAGMYATLYYCGHYNTLNNLYKHVTSKINDLGYTIIGNIYEEDLSDYFIEKNPESFIMKVSVQIEGIDPCGAKITSAKKIPVLVT